MTGLQPANIILEALRQKVFLSHLLPYIIAKRLLAKQLKYIT